MMKPEEASKFFAQTTLIVSIFFLSTFPTVYARQDLKECVDWSNTCKSFKRYPRGPKTCLGSTIFYYSDFETDWQTARVYCTSILGSYGRADVLYFDENGDSDLRAYIENYLPQEEEFPTSALCCPSIISRNGQPHMEIRCKWLYNQAEINSKFYSGISLDPTSCHYLIANLSNDRKVRINKSSPVGDLQPHKFICTYKKPEFCYGDQTTTESYPTTNSTTTPTATTPNPVTDPDIKRCEGKTEYGIDWPTTEVNQTAFAECPDNFTGQASWKCGLDGHFVEEGPKIDCRRKWIDNINNKLDNVTDIDELSHELHKFKDNFKKEPVEYPKDLEQSIQVIEKVQYLYESFAANASETDQVNQTKARTIVESVVESCSDMISKDQPWKLSESESRTSIAGKMLNYIQNSGVTLGCVLASNESNQKIEPISSDEKNIYLSAFNMDHEQPILFSYFDFWFKMKEPLHTDQNVSDWCPHRLAIGALFKKLSSYMFDENYEVGLKMNSEIIAFSYNNKTKETFPLPDDNKASMSLIHHQLLDFGAVAKCVFWNYKEKTWSSEGCWIDIKNSDRNQTTCICNHLTNFAVLMDVSGQEKPSQIKSILTILTCTASIICLILTILFFKMCRELRSRRTTVIVNISIVMILIDLLVIFGLDQTNYPIFCKFVSVTLLYTMLALFSWMLLQGYTLYQMLVMVFDGKGYIPTLYLYMIAYGSPLLITIAGVIYMGLETELTNEYFCWITSTKYPYQIWILAGPVTLIIIINSFIMIKAMKIIKDRKNTKPGTMSGMNSFVNSSDNNKKSKGNFRNNILTGAKNRKQTGIKTDFHFSERTNNSNESQTEGSSLEQKMSDWYAYLKGFFGLIVLMGITWISYVLYIHQFGHYFSYVFIIMNGLQGVFIFITQFLLNKKALNMVRRKIFQAIGYDGLSGSSTKDTSSSYLSQQRASKPSLGNILNQQQRQMDNNFRNEDDLNLIVDQGRQNALIDRTTSMEF